MSILSLPKRLVCLCLSGLIAVLIAGCGNKGALYLPAPAERKPISEDLSKKPATSGPAPALTPQSE